MPFNSTAHRTGIYITCSLQISVRRVEVQSSKNESSKNEGVEALDGGRICRVVRESALNSCVVAG